MGQPGAITNLEPLRPAETRSGHERQWLDSIKSRVEPDCRVNYHYKVDLALTLASLSYTLGRPR